MLMILKIEAKTSENNHGIQNMFIVYTHILVVLTTVKPDAYSFLSRTWLDSRGNLIIEY